MSRPAAGEKNHGFEPHIGNFWFCCAVFACCLEPHIGNFRGPRLLALLPRTPLDASCPVLAVDGADFGVSCRVSLVSRPAATLFIAPVLPTPLSRGAPDGRESRPRPGSLPAPRTSHRSSARSNHPGFSVAVPALLSLWRLSGGYLVEYLRYLSGARTLRRARRMRHRRQARAIRAMPREGNRNARHRKVVLGSYAAVPPSKTRRAPPRCR